MFADVRVGVAVVFGLRFVLVIAIASKRRKQERCHSRKEMRGKTALSEEEDNYRCWRWNGTIDDGEEPGSKEVRIEKKKMKNCFDEKGVLHGTSV